MIHASIMAEHVLDHLTHQSPSGIVWRQDEIESPGGDVIEMDRGSIRGIGTSKMWKLVYSPWVTEDDGCTGPHLELAQIIMTIIERYERK